MTPLAFLAAALAAVAVAAAAGVLVRPTRRLAPRVQPYAQLSRSRLGRAADLSLLSTGDSSLRAPTVGRVFGPLVVAAARRLSNVVDAINEQELARRLRQAGLYEVSPEQYRIRQLGWSTGGVLAYGAIAFILDLNAGLVLAATVVGAITGLSHWRGRVNKAIKSRRSRMRVELYTVAHLMAMTMRTGQGPIEAMYGVTRKGRGPVVEELAEVLRWIGGGMDEVEALERLAEETPEPAAARLYRLIASGIAAGGDLAKSLLSTSDDLRAERREDLERLATSRRGAMIAPTVVVMAPVMLLFLAAPLPSIIFGAK